MLITARDQNGDIIYPDNRKDHYIQAWTEAGPQELTELLALYEFLRLHFPAEVHGIPQSIYGENGSAMGRISQQTQ